MMPRHRDSVTVTSGRGSPAVRPGLKIFSLECRSDHTSIDWSTRERTSLRSMRCSYGRKATMPQYSFTIRSSDHEHKAERCVVLQDVAAALDRALSGCLRLSVVAAMGVEWAKRYFSGQSIESTSPGGRRTWRSTGGFAVHYT
jgi:hypothetical protein